MNICEQDQKKAKAYFSGLIIQTIELPISLSFCFAISFSKF